MTIIERPKVDVSRVRECGRDSGVVQLSVVFHKSGKVTEVEIVTSSGCEFFDRAALKAAKAIKFKPARQDGNNITVTKRVEYRFTTF